MLTVAVTDLAAQLGIELVAWPEGEELRGNLALAGVPRLLVVAEDAAAPDQVDLDEDWVRLPDDHGDAEARLRRIVGVLTRFGGVQPWIDGAQVVHRGRAAFPMTGDEAVVVEALLAVPGTLVEREELERRLWPEGVPRDRALSHVIHRLRRRLRGTGMYVRTVRGRGFVLESLP